MKEPITKETVAARIDSMKGAILMFETLGSLATVRGNQHVLTLAEIGLRLTLDAESEASQELNDGSAEDADVVLNVAEAEADAFMAGIEALSPGWIDFIRGTESAEQGEQGNGDMADLARSVERHSNTPRLTTRIDPPTSSGMYAS